MNHQEQKISIKTGAFFVLAATVLMILALGNDSLFEVRIVSEEIDAGIQTVCCRWDRRIFENGMNALNLCMNF